MNDEMTDTVEVDVNAMLADGSVVASGTAAEHPYGVLYQGPWETLEDGTCRAVRGNARALRRAGLPVLLQSFNHVRISGGMQVHVFDSGHDAEVLSRVGNLHQTSIGQLSLSIKHMVVNTPDQVLAVLYPRGIVGNNDHGTQQWKQMIASSTVLYTVWERDQISRDIARVLNRAGQIWVPCLQNQQMLISSGIPESKVFVVPHTYSDEEYTRVYNKKSPLVDHPAFYSVGAWQPRKGMHELIGAFLRAFRADGEVRPTLRIKTTEYQWKNYPAPRESIMQWLEDATVKANGWSISTIKGRVSVFTKRFTAEQMDDLHRSNNIYVCASHGEAWCLPAFDAKLYGNVLVHVPWGGTAEFADPEYDVRIPYQLEAVNDEYGWGDSKWAGFTMQALQDSLRASLCAQRTYLTDRFSELEVGQKMRENLRQLSQGKSSPGVHKYLFGG